MRVPAFLVFAAAFTLAAGPVLAGETRLAHQAILDILTGATVAGPDWTQSFDTGGATTYVGGGRTSTGRWDVQGDQYCSQWPPSDMWSCYDVSTDAVAGATTITWIAPSGSRETGHLVPKG